MNGLYIWLTNSDLTLDSWAAMFNTLVSFMADTEEETRYFIKLA